MPHPLDPRRTGLVVIDVQNDYFPGGKFVLFRARSALARTLQLRDWARRKGLPIWWIRHTSPSPRAFFLLPNTPGAELHAALGPLPSEPIVDKHDPNSFVATDLEAQLRAHGVDTVVWAGMISWMCVETTVRSAKDKGFRNWVARDAVASGWISGPYGPVTPWSAHRAFLSALGFAHAELLSTRQILRSL